MRKHGFTASHILQDSMTFFCLSATFQLHFWFTTLSARYVRVLVFIYGVMLCKLLLHVMIAHVSEQEFQSVRISILASCASVWFYFALPRSRRLDEDLFVWILLVFNTLSMRGKSTANSILAPAVARGQRDGTHPGHPHLQHRPSCSGPD